MSRHSDHGDLPFLVVAAVVIAVVVGITKKGCGRGSLQFTGLEKCEFRQGTFI